jgi:hypothetical protein
VCSSDLGCGILIIAPNFGLVISIANRRWENRDTHHIFDLGTRRQSSLGPNGAI